MGYISRIVVLASQDVNVAMYSHTNRTALSPVVQSNGPRPVQFAILVIPRLIKQASPILYSCSRRYHVGYPTHV